MPDYYGEHEAISSAKCDIIVGSRQYFVARKRASSNQSNKTEKIFILALLLCDYASSITGDFYICNVEKRGIFFQNVEKQPKIDGLENRTNLSITNFEKDIWTHPTKYRLYKGTRSKQKSLSN